MIYTSRLDDKQVVIDIKRDAKYGLMLSGGLDSAVLLTMLLNSGIDIENLQLYTIDKVDGSHKAVQRVVEHINNKFSINLAPTILVGDPTVYHREQSKTAVRDIFENYDTDYLFNALNQNPPELTNMPYAPQRDTKSPNEQIILPFVELYKTHIIDFMYEMGNSDLAEVTHTCTEQQAGRCNVCWQCGERAWAFKQLALEDKGTQ
jgi:7-cyano-7-deazaguanine synthase in queuosine biosynthesis